MKRATGGRMRETTVRLRPIDDDNAAFAIRAGQAEDLAGAVRRGLLLLRRLAETEERVSR